MVDGIETTFADRVLPVDMAVARFWGELSASRSLPAIDTLIAATAMVHRLTLVTRNTRNGELTGVLLIDPWKSDDGGTQGLAYRRITSSFLISAIAFAGLRFFGQVRVQFMIVWQR